MNTVIEAKNIKKYYAYSGAGTARRSRKTLHALDGVSLSVHKGEILGVVGESGCGKSTLGRCLLRLVDITEGEIFFEGTDITRKTRRELKPYRRNMQMIFQNPFSSFNPKLRIGDSLREVGQVYGMDREAAYARILELLDYIRLPEDVLHRGPSELSGGQLQRLAIARALFLNPSFIVADEPVSALDVSVQAQILNLIVDLREQLQMTLLFISHEMTVIEHICDTVAVMYLGKVVELAPKRLLFRKLLHPYTQALMSAIPRADPDASSERIILMGDIPNAMDLPPGCRFASRCRDCMEICRRQEPELKDTGSGHYAACHLVSSCTAEQTSPLQVI